MASNKYFKVIAENRKAHFDYNILEVYQAGLVLKGNEVKSIRQGSVNLKDSFGRIEKEALWIYGMHIRPYSPSDQRNYNPTRPRKALLQKRELLKLMGKVAEKGLTVIPLKVYFQGNWAKLEVALAKAKKKYEKRETLRRKTAQREIEAAFKGKVYDRKVKT